MADLPDEHARQRELDTYRVLDTLPEAAYDDIVRLASVLCDAPIALVSLVDRDRQWLKARSGFELSETPRDIAFCDHAIRDPEALLEVQDATRDARFAANPLVTQVDGVRFYAGMPLVTPSGAAIGTVCVLDRQPRELTAVQRAALGSLARVTMNLLEARHRERELLLAHQLQSLAANPAPAPVPERKAASEPYTIAVFELQDFAGAVQRSGERAIERALGQLDQALDACLDHARGDCLSRSTGSPESIVVLRGEDVGERWRKLQDAVPAFERHTHLRVLSANAPSHTAEEPLDAVFLRADAALSRAKDAACGAGLAA